MEKIRIWIVAANRPKLIYTYKLYAFRTENESIEPLNLLEIAEDDNHNEFDKPNGRSENELNFKQEWIPQKVIEIVVVVF